MATRSTTGGVAEPKQQRSRESFARVRAAVLQLLQARGTGQFSLAEVSTTAGVSIGSIYGRVGSKAELLRAVQDEEFDRLDTDTDVRLRAAGQGAQNLREATADIVGAYAGMLRSNQELLSPFFLLGVEDTVILDRGRRSGQIAQAAFTAALRAAAGEHDTQLSAAQAHWVFEIVYSISVRFLGLGVASTVNPDQPYDWSEVVARLSDTAYLIIASS